MPYCLKCGNKVDETMAFCPNCGTALKDQPQNQAAPPPKPEENPHKHEGAEVREHGFLTYLMGGLILVTIGVFGILGLTSSFLTLGQDVVLMMVIIGVIIVCGTLYIITPVRKYLKQHISHTKNPE